MQITPALLLKEATYNAVGAAYYDLHDYIDFKSWFVTLKVVVLEDNSHNFFCHCDVDAISHGFFNVFIHVCNFLWSTLVLMVIITY